MKLAELAEQLCKMVEHQVNPNEVHQEMCHPVLEVLRIRFLLDPAPEPEPLPKELELELLGSGSLLESDPPMESAIFWVCISLILIQEAPSV